MTFITFVPKQNSVVLKRKQQNEDDAPPAPNEIPKKRK
jgi:hypothetical protein